MRTIRRRLAWTGILVMIWLAVQAAAVMAQEEAVEAAAETPRGVDLMFFLLGIAALALIGFVISQRDREVSE